jgi:hypothetical protein
MFDWYRMVSAWIGCLGRPLVSYGEFLQPGGGLARIMYRHVLLFIASLNKKRLNGHEYIHDF